MPSFPTNERAVPKFEVGSWRGHRRAIIVLRGALDLTTTARVEEAVRRHRARECRSIVLDLRLLTFIDSSGLQLLFRLDATARSDGFSFAIIDGDGPVRALFETTGLTEHFQRAGA
jgi:anti-anti-sigma factor